MADSFSFLHPYFPWFSFFLSLAWNEKIWLLVSLENSLLGYVVFMVESISVFCF